METSYVFQIGPVDTAALLPQVSRALEKRTELLSRRCCPGMWKLTDRLNAVEKVPEEVRKKRTARRKALTLVNCLLALFLLIPVLVTRRELLIPVLSLGCGTAVLWRSLKGRGKNRFRRAAELLLRERNSLPAGCAPRVSFLPEGMALDAEIVPYSDFEYVIEERDLFLLTYGERVTLLRKKDLAEGGLDDFRAFIAARTALIREDA